MDGMRHPVGRQSANVYWRRRLVVLLGVILLVVVAWFLITSPSGDGSDQPAADSSLSPDAAISSDAAEDGDPSRACGVDDVEIIVTPNPFNVTLGSIPAFDVSITHVGSASCLLSTGGTDSELVITSGDTQIYTTADCPSNSTINERDFLLSDGTTETFSVNWNGQWSAPECGTSTNTTKAGYYWATLTLQGIEAEPAQFQLSE